MKTTPPPGPAALSIAACRPALSSATPSPTTPKSSAVRYTAAGSSGRVVITDCASTGVVESTASMPNTSRVNRNRISLLDDRATFVAVDYGPGIPLVTYSRPHRRSGVGVDARPTPGGCMRLTPTIAIVMALVSTAGCATATVAANGPEAPAHMAGLVTE